MPAPRHVLRLPAPSSLFSPPLDAYPTGRIWHTAQRPHCSSAAARSDWGHMHRKITDRFVRFRSGARRRHRITGERGARGRREEGRHQERLACCGPGRLAADSDRQSSGRTNQRASSTLRSTHVPCAVLSDSADSLSTHSVHCSPPPRSSASAHSPLALPRGSLFLLSALLVCPPGLSVRPRIMDVSSSPQIVEHLSHSVNFTPFDAKWVPMSAKFAVVGSYPKGTGAIQSQTATSRPTAGPAAKCSAAKDERSLNRRR